MKLPSDEAVHALMGIGLASLCFGLAIFLIALAWLMINSVGC